jgi:hypothetical protein
VIAAVSVLAVAGIGLVEARKPVRVQDGAGRITIDVPRRWSRELLPSGWDPGVLALSGGHQPGLLVSSDIAGWRDLDRDVAGVFVGLSDDPGLPAAVGRIDHPGCRALAARTFSDPRWSGRIRRWDRCHGQNGSLEEINLLGRGSGPEQVYVQVRQVSGRDHTDQVLASLRVAG